MSMYEDKLKEVGNNNQLLFSKSEMVAPAFKQMHDKAIALGALDEKTKELIALGIAIADRCEGCIVSHVNSCKKLGVTKQEILETVEVAIMMGGGPSTVYGGKALACAEEIYG